MASPTFTLLNAGGLTDGVINDADANTGWTNLTTADTDIKVEGTGSMSGITRNDGEDSYYDSGGAPVTAVGKVLRGWVNTTNLPYMNTEAADPYKLWCFDGTTQSNGLALFGSDTYPGGWFYFWQDMDDFTGVTLANVDRWGIEAGHSSNAKNVINMWMDVLRYMDGYSFTGGTSGDKVELADIAASDKTSAYGIVRESGGVYFATGTIQIGSGATTTYFEMDNEVLVFLDTPGALSINAGLYDITATGSGCDCIIKNSVLRSAGTTDATRFVLDFSDTNHTLTFTDNLITRAGATTFASGQSPTNNVYDNCGQITAAGADMTGSIVKNYEGTANTSALIWNVNTNPSTYLDEMEFTKGTAATHAIEFGASIPSAITLTNMTFTGYNASDNQNDSVLHFKDTTGTITVTLVGTTQPSYRTDGATIEFVTNPVNVTAKASNTAGSGVQSARAFVYATSTTGSLPAGDTVTIVNSGTTATVSHTAHNLKTNDKVWIQGASLAANNGVFTVTVTNANEYTYTMGSSPGSSPTGTITSTFVFLSGTTDVNGEITMSRSLLANQSAEGWARKSSAADDPKYRQGTIPETTISSSVDSNLTAVMISDG